MTSPIKTGSTFFNLTKFVFANSNPHQKTMGNNFIHQNRANSPNNLSPLKKTVGFLCWSSLQNFTKTIEHRREKNNHNVSSGRHHNHPQEESSAPPISHSLFIFACEASPILHKSQCQRKVSYLVRPPSWSKMCVRLPRR